MCSLYACSFLPYGRFYNRLGGNIGMLGAYMYIYLYLTFSYFRRIFFLETFFNYIFNKLFYLTNFGETKKFIKNQSGITKFLFATTTSA